MADSVKFAAVHESLDVQVFGCRHDEFIHELWRPASEKRQGTNAKCQRAPLTSDDWGKPDPMRAQWSPPLMTPTGHYRHWPKAAGCTIGFMPAD